MHQLPRTSRPCKRRCLSQLEEETQGEVFQEATGKLPKFVEQNFDQPDQIIKVFRNDNQAHLKIFIFQYLEMCYGGSRNRNAENYMERIYELLQKPEFQFFLPDQPSTLKDQTHINMKNLLSQFLNQLTSSSMSIQASLNRYPIILDIFVSFMRTLLYLGDICDTFNEEVPMEDIYEFLTSYFQVESIREENWIRFIYSGVFGYEERKDQIYMIYKKKDKKHESVESSTIKQQTKSENNSVNVFVSNIEIDMSSTAKEKTVNFHNTLPTLQLKMKKSTQDKRKKKQLTEETAEGSAFMNSTFSRSGEEEFNKKTSLMERTQRPTTKFQSSQKLKPKDYHDTLKKIVAVDTSETFYRPTTSTSSNWMQDSKKQNSWVNPNITKQFTSSFILQQVSQPYRSQIQKRKARARQERKTAQFMIL